MSEAYLRRLRICFLELSRHDVFNTEGDAAFQEYLNASQYASKLEPVLFAGEVAYLYFMYRYLPRGPPSCIYCQRPFLVTILGLTLMAVTHVSVTRAYISEPLNTVAIRYEREAREFCNELKVYKPLQDDSKQ